MKQLYLRTIYLFVFSFFILGVQGALAGVWHYSVIYNHAESRIYMELGKEDKNSKNAMYDVYISFSLDGGATYHDILKEARKDNYMGRDPDLSYLVDNGSGWDGNVDKQRYYIKVPIEWMGKNVIIKTHYYWGFPGDLGGDKIDTFSIAGLAAPNILTSSSNGEQNTITVNWNETEPKVISAALQASTNNIKYDLLRNNVAIATLNYGTTTYADNNTSDKVKYSYKVRVRYAFPSGGNYSSIGNSLEVWKNPKLSITPSYAPCDTGIKLAWGTPELDDSYKYKITRSSRSDFSTDLQIFNIESISKSTYFDDSKLTHMGTSYYKIEVLDVNNKLVSQLSSSEVSIQTNLEPSVPVISLTDEGNRFVIGWSEYACSNVTDFELLRKTYQGNTLVNEQSIIIPKNTFKYIDNNLQTCNTYKYQLKARNASASAISKLIERAVSDNIADAFVISLGDKTNPQHTFYNHDYKFKASKGFYTNYVQLQWDASYKSKIQSYNIYRKVVGTTSNKELVKVVEGGSATLWMDEYTEANTIYEYTIEGVSTCDGQAIQTMQATTLGFRAPYGNVSGRISFAGGQGVEGVMVRARNTEGPAGKAIRFKNSQAMLAVFSADVFWPSQQGWALEAWVRPDDATKPYVLYDHYKSDSGLKVYFDGTKYVLQTTTDQISIMPTGQFRNNEFTHIAVSLNTVTREVQWVINDKIYPVQHLSAAFTRSTFINPPLVIGNSQKNGEAFIGVLDEIRVWSKARTSTEMVRDHTRYLTGSEPGLVAYWRADEGFGTSLFDASKFDRKYNENHASLLSGNGYEWTSIIPSESQLANVAYTDAKGDYKMTGIQFHGSGETYEITPMLGVHQFDPTSMQLFIGEGSLSHNSKDFKDVSSFVVTGAAYYQNTTFPVEGVQVLVDGATIIGANNLPVVTGANGEFEARVPIGQHTLSFVKHGHDLSLSKEGVLTGEAYWPGKGETFDFQTNLAGALEIVDTSKRKLIGRVVGGQVEGDKPLGMGLSVNNIGRAIIKLVPERSGYDMDKNTPGLQSYIQLTTDQITGEYSALIVPEKFIVESVKSINAKDDGSYYTYEQHPILNLTLPAQDSTWSYKLNNKGIKVDSVGYNFAKNFIFHTSPTMSINDGNVLGETSLKIDEAGPAIDLSGKPFNHPIFKMNSVYRYPIKFYEEFENADNSVRTTVPITTAKVSIQNDWKGGRPEEYDLADKQGVLNYEFRAGGPNLTAPYTSQLQVLVKLGESSYTAVAGGTKTGYVLGQETHGSGIITNGPDLVEFVLRDPPGSSSYAYLEKGSSFSNSTTISTTNSGTTEINPTFSLGVETTIGTGIGVMVLAEAEVTQDVSSQLAITQATTDEGEFIETTEIKESIKTSDSEEFVGSAGDLFVGKAQNFVIAETNNLELLPMDSVYRNLERSEAVMIGNKEYALVKRKGIAAAKDNFATRFMVSQFAIENQIIPGLKRLRDHLLLRGDGVFVPKITKDNVRFGADNYDSLAFPTTYLPKVKGVGVATRSQYTGPSYAFNPRKEGDRDSVYLLNQQIRLWEEALSDNEENKIVSLDKAKGGKNNITFDGGTTYTWEKNLQTERTVISTFEVTSDASLESVTGASFNGFGMELRVMSGYSNAKSTTDGSTTSKGMIFGYEFKDANKGDYFSVDVIDPSVNSNTITSSSTFYTPMFYTRGGQTSCPYEGGEFTKYYQKGLKQLNAATLQREKPEIRVDNQSVSGVPETSAAVFKLRLQNNSESEEDMWYSIRVDESSNQDGAILQIDGASPNRAFNVPYGKFVEKVLTVRKGPGAVFSYKNLGIILSSSCQTEEIADTVLVSAHFNPACTPVKLIAPLNNWLANVDSNGVLPIVVSGYDVNLGTFKSVEIQYKSTASNTWATIYTYYNRENDYNEAIANGESSVAFINKKTTLTYDWKISDLPDRNYEVRAKSVCADGSVSYTEVSKGLKDETPPLVFGTPQPADGILSPNDEIMIQFAEPIEAGLVSKNNISVRGVLNGSDRAHGSFLNFDGQQAYVKIPEGLRLDNRSFTVEFWARSAAGTAESIVVTQGAGNEIINIGFDATGKFYTEWGANQRLTANKALASATWNHYAVSFDAATGNASLYGNEQILAELNYAKAYEGIGQILVGKSFNGDKAFNGDLYALRVWDTYKSRDEVYALQSKNLNGTERSLVGAWPMNDLAGTGVKDVARALHGVSTAQWVAEPASKAIKFTGNGYVSVPSEHSPITKNTDFTLEFWFKAGADAKETTLFSASLLGTDMQWSLDIDNKGGIFLKQAEVQFKGIDNDVLDNKWHHLAMVTDRRGNLTFFLDGEQKNSRKASALANLTAPALYFGARYVATTNLGGTPAGTIDRNYKGNLDEIRLWNSARTAEQINRAMRSKQGDNLPDLQIYLPFESYINNSGIMVSTNSAGEFSGKTVKKEATFVNTTYTAESPLIDRPQPEQKVNFTYVVNQDKILISLNEPAALVEKTKLDITVQGILDKNSNAMQGSKTWSVFVDKNQVKWANTRLRFEKQLYEPLSFEVEIVNMGGSQENFTIEGVPSWLTPQPATGVIEPNSRKTIKFVVEESLNIGNYSKDLFLRTNFGYDEKLSLDLKVFAVSPKWTVNPADFDKSMSITGQIKMNDRFSTNPDDKVVALVNGEVRGVAQPKYVAGYDRYMFFMDVYGKVNEAEQVKFNIWNASLGVVHTDVTPAAVTFRDGELYGSPANPLVLTANNEVYQSIALKKGWNWVSFNVGVANKEISDVINPDLLNTRSILMSQQWTADYSGNSWSPPGKKFNNIESYLLKVETDAAMRVKGGLLNTANERIILKKGWNWVGYTPQASMPVKDALASATLNSGDMIKGQTGFAIYDDYMGWIGSLSYLRSGEGYRVKSSKTADVSFTYPKASVNSGARVAKSENDKAFAATNLLFSELVSPHNYQFSMNMVAEIASDKVQEGTVISATNAQGEKVGWGVGQQIGGKVLYFITAYSNQEKQDLYFAYHDADGKQLAILEQKETFKGEQSLGTLSVPYRFTSTSELPALVPAVISTKVYPNPFSDKLTLNWVNTPEEQATVDLLDLAGRKLSTIYKGTQDGEYGNFVWEDRVAAALPAGVYIIRIKQAGQQQIIRVVKK
ncbi:LamG-like jellyroll fold domain-containing protein [Pontibacter oryzae]|uniref:T9SS C-terminal target domain-containing protein n=1 Tax=Pontibacter oryzae TaxID=2304593 RepID=A0A399RQH1_9BACT|nr:LamG-like jellyroll fold domain-containing protein [Pontibacter oryzae]RIJ34060.1 T9SS C-terminal target domain-containing protein [Pontibacter oryzae]